MAENAAEAERQPAAEPAPAGPAAAAVSALAPSTAAVLSLQGSIGNAGVVALLRSPRAAPPGVQARGALLARKKLEVNQKNVGKQLPEDQNFAWFGSPSSPRLVVKRSWLEANGVVPGSTDIVGAEHPEIIRPILSELVDKYPWAVPRRDEILTHIDTMRLSVRPESWQDEEMDFGVDRTVFATIGLPPEAPIQVFAAQGGLEIMVDVRHLAGQDIPARVLDAIEATTTVPILPARRPLLLNVIRGILGKVTGAIRLTMSEQLCHRFFGEAAWRKHLADLPPGEDGEGAVIFTAGGAFNASDLSDKDRKMVEEVLQKLFGPSKAPDPNAPALQLSKGEVDLLRQLSKDPELLEKIRKLLRSAKKTEGATSLADMLQSAAQAIDFREWAKLLGVKLGSGDRDEPIVKRPVHGLIFNKTGALVPKQEARFEFIVTDAVDAFRVPMVNIKWVAIRKPEKGERYPGKAIRQEGTWYGEVREEGLLNDKTFQVTFDAPGVYEIHAFVNHNFYNPAHFSIDVEVKLEKERLEALDEKAATTFGATAEEAKPYRFGDVAAEDLSVRIGLGGALLGVSGQLLALLGPGSGYEVGTRATGNLTGDMASANAFDRGAVQLDEEIKRLDDLSKILKEQSEERNADLLKWIKDKRDKLAATKSKIVDAKGGAGSHGINCQGSYVSRSSGVRGGPLKLLAWFTHDGSRYHGHLLDRSQLVRSEDFHFEAKADSYEKVMESLFWELTRTYPDGTMSFAFQVYDAALKPTGGFVRFTRRTDTQLKDVKNVVFSQPASIAVNIVATVLTVFPPTTAAGIALSVTYNGAAAALELSDAMRSGTVNAGHIVNLGLVALDLLPAVGKTAKLLKTSRGFVWAVKSVQYGGQAFMLTEGAYLRIKGIRDNQVTRLAELQDQIARTREVNESDPDLARMEKEAEALKVEIRKVTEDVILDTIKNDGLTIAAMHTVGKMAEAHLGQRGGGAPHDPSVPKDTPEGPVPKVPPEGPVPKVPHEGPPVPKDTPTVPKDTPTVPKETPKVPKETPKTAPKEPPLPVGSDPRLAAGLPPELRSKVRVAEHPSVKGEGSVEVHYTLDALGLVSEVEIRVSKGATPAQVGEHARTAQLMLDYKGVSGLARVVFEHVSAVLGRRGKPLQVGSKAWEAKLEIEKLPPIIQARMEQLRLGGLDEAGTARIEREIAYLKEQLERHQNTLDRMETEGGRGFVAATGEHNTAARNEGYPPIEKAPGHYYEPKPEGGYELRQFKDSPHPPMELYNDNGQWKVRKAEPTRAPAGVTDLGLHPAALEKVLSAMSGDQALSVSTWLGSGRLEAASGLKNGLGQALRVHERLGPHLNDAAAMRGLMRLTEPHPKGRSQPMSTENVLGVLAGVPKENLGAFLRAIGDPAMQHPQGQGKTNLTTLGQDARKLQFIDEHGFQTLADLRGETPREKLVWQKLWEQLKTLKTPEDRRALVQKVLDEPSTVARERMFGIERRAPARKVTEAKADPTDPNWATHVKDATRTVDKNLAAIEARGAKAGKTPAEARAAAIEAYATVLQVTERISGRWQEHQSLSQKTKIGILDQIDQLGAQGGLPQGWTNNARGRIGEALYGPHGGLNQTSLPNPLHPVPAEGGKPERPGFSRLDDRFGPGERPGNTSGTSDWMEIKTHRIDEPPKKGDVSADAVTTARDHAAEALQDWHALLANQSTRGDGIVIQYAREPHNTATREAMLDVLFGPDSPLTAVRFGNGPWIERSAARPNSPMPPVPKELAAGPIVGTNGKGVAPVTPPSAVPTGSATE